MSPSAGDANIEERMAQLKSGDDEDQIIIGIDFGTTYSGIAYCFTGSEKVEPISILDWPGNKGVNAPKVPTVIAYTQPSNGSFNWGYELDPTSSDKIEAIKLLLDPDQPKTLYVPPSQTKAELKKLNKPAVDVASDFLKALYSHAWTKIEATCLRTIWLFKIP
ncbi:MAG: hypothetical protein M1814_000493 [Vezdaea aestivalis]|nr:MAG: hypothetical protein M1814_000493 [Vezdaea aestivalis]